MFPLSQRDSSATECEAEVLECTPSRSVQGAFDVVLSDTVLFAENGGQPCDHGTIAGRPVACVRVPQPSSSSLARPVHVGVQGPAFAIGERVRVSLDGARRLDHTQQHSAQHLLSALAATPAHGALRTVGWALLPDRALVEFAAAAVPADALCALEAAANDAVRQARPVRVDVFPNGVGGAPDEALLLLRSRGNVPREGPLRVVTIEGIDCATCCGTHVTNTAQLQAIKILGAERSRAGCTRVAFLAGGRVLGALGAALARERALGELLRCQPESFASHVSGALQELSAETKLCKRLVAELAASDAQRLLDRIAAEEEAASSLVVEHHRSGLGAMEYLDAVAAIVTQRLPDSKLLLLTACEASACEGRGVFLVYGPPELVAKAGAIAREVLGGKGGGKGRRLQGKADHMERRPQLLRRLADDAGLL